MSNEIKIETAVEQFLKKVAQQSNHRNEKLWAMAQALTEIQRLNLSGSPYSIKIQNECKFAFLMLDRLLAMEDGLPHERNGPHTKIFSLFNMYFDDRASLPEKERLAEGIQNLMDEIIESRKSNVT